MDSKAFFDASVQVFELAESLVGYFRFVLE
jgi:hypothetical protein